MLKVKKVDFKKAGGTSLSGYIDVAYEDLVKAFGEPSYTSGDMYDKVTTEWVLDIEGTIVTIYNWKEGPHSEQKKRDWHVGGFGADERNKLEQALIDRRVICYVRNMKFGM